MSKKEVINNKPQTQMSTEKTKDSLWKMLADFFAGEKTDEEIAAEEKMAAGDPPAETPPATEPPAPTDNVEEIKAENEMLKKENEDLKAKILELEAGMVKTETDLETMKKEFETFKANTPAAPSISATPRVEVVNKPYEQMTNFEKLKFNKENGIR